MILPLKWISFTEAPFVIEWRIRARLANNPKAALLLRAMILTEQEIPLSELDQEAIAEIRSRSEFLQALKNGELFSEGQPGSDDQGIFPEYRQIPEAWWFSIALIGTVDCYPPGPPFDVTVIDWQRSAIRWTRSSTPPVTNYFRNIRVQRADLDRVWPEASEAVSSSLPTGMAGRPSKGAHLIQNEFQRRVAAGEILSTLAEEARELLNWYSRTYPEEQQPTARTAENHIRADYNAAKAGTSPRPKGGR